MDDKNHFISINEKFAEAVFALTGFADKCTDEIESLKKEIADLKHEIYNLKR